MTFGENLQRLRQAAGLSQSGLAARCGLSVRSLQNWEIDRVLPRIDAAARLARGLGVSLEALTGVFLEGPADGGEKGKKSAGPKGGKRGARRDG